MKNYLEHNVLVRYTEACLELKRDWDWFGEELKKSFELTDISSWSDFIKRSYLLKIYSYITRIVRIEGYIFDTENELLNDIRIVSEYYCGIIDVEICKKSLVSLFGKTLLLFVWGSRLENADNNTEYVYNLKLFCQHNYYELINCRSLVLEQDSLLDYSREIKLDGFESVTKCLEDNLTQTFYPMHKGFLDKYRDNFLLANCFSYQTIEDDPDWSWEECFLIDMVKTSIVDRTINPAVVGNGWKNPNTDLWTEKTLQIMLDYFSNPIASFILESVRYVLHGIAPSKETICMHCKLYVEQAEELQEFEITSVSSYRILSYLFKDRLMGIMSKEKEYLQLVERIHKEKQISTIRAFENDGFPISKEQRKTIKEYYDGLFMSIDNIDNVNEFLEYIDNSDVAKRIDNPYFDKVLRAFEKYTKDKTDRMIIPLFTHFMSFLLEVKANAVNINKKIVCEWIIDIQQKWENEYYDVICGGMALHSTSVRLSKEVTEKICSEIIENPIAIAKTLTIADETKTLETMERTSEYVLSSLVTKVVISPIYPMQDKTIVYERHDVDRMLRDIVGKIKEEKGYRLLNQLDTDKYVKALLREYQDSLMFISSMLYREDELYNRVSDGAEIEMIPYSRDITLAHITQLFPVLERKIRELAIQTGYVPFKERKDDFMKYKDSSSILRDMITDNSEITNSFENVADLLFVYNSMYNGNSLNVRNECLHGRNYLFGDNLRMGFRLTMISINMLQSRLETISMNALS